MARKKRVLKKAADAHKESLKIVKKAVLESVCKSIWTEAQGYRGRVPYGYVSSLLREHEVTYETIGDSCLDEWKEKDL